MNQRTTLVLASLFGTLAVAFGAFGAHALKDILTTTGRSETFDLAVRYHFYHTLALLATGILMEKFPKLKTSSWLFSGGIIIFSGSLYTLALTNQTWWGAVTPFGGALFIAGWAALGLTFLKSQKNNGL